MALGWLTGLSGPVTAAQPAIRTEAVACLSCVILQVDSTAAWALAAAPAGLLGGLTIVTRGDVSARLLDGLAATGATPGVRLALGEPVQADVLRRAVVVIVDGIRDDDEAVRALRTLATAARAARAGVRILVPTFTRSAEALRHPETEALRHLETEALRHLEAEALRHLETGVISAPSGGAALQGCIPAERLSAYVDGCVMRALELSCATPEALSAASMTRAGHPVVVELRQPDWRSLAAFARLRAFGSGVDAPAVLTVHDIIARHQARRRLQDEMVRRTIASGATTLMFEVPGFVAPVIVTAETVVYSEPGVVEVEQRDIRVNGAAIAGGNAASPPRLPLIEPGRIATQPLTITLSEAYRYELAGRDHLDSGDAYIVAFEPVTADRRSAVRGPQSGSRIANDRGRTDRGSRTADRALAFGRAWIDASTFALVRLEAVQTGLRGAIVSSEQHDDFAPFLVGGETVWLPVRTSVYQMYEGAGHRTSIHRAIVTPSYAINPPDFEARLQAAHASPHVMLRDTPQGFRYLLTPKDAGEGTARALAPRAGERIRAAVAGVVVDPNITVPLPFAGVSYVDVNVMNSGAQVNAFFGGSYGQLSWSVPSLGGTRWQANGRVFAIAASYNDRSFRGGVEQYGENITQRPAHVSAGVVRPVTPRLRIRADYALDYTTFDRAGTTAHTFVEPMDAIVHGLVASVEAGSGPWTARAWWNPARRQRWRTWGEVREQGAGSREQREQEEGREFQRFGVDVSRTLALGPVLGSRVELAWMGGSDLDRFSRYSFGAFEQRLRGYPTASIRYDRGAVARSVTSWSARGWRVDAFADMAVVRDPGFGDRARGYPGLGAALEGAGPFSTLWSVEWGYGFRGRREDGSLGTQALRITAYRTF